MELIVVMGRFALLAGAIKFFPIDFFYARSLDDDAAKVAFTLRGAHDRSVTQDSASAWGVHFVNPASGGGYYQVFKGDTFGTGTVVEKINLNETIQFASPPSASSTDVMFSKIYGLPSGASFIILSIISKPATIHTVTILTSGQTQY